MTLDTVRERMAECLRKREWKRSAPGPGERAGACRGRWRRFPCAPARAGRAASGIIWGSATTRSGAAGRSSTDGRCGWYSGWICMRRGPTALRRSGPPFDVVAGALQREGPEGLKLLELSCGEVEDDPGTDLLRCPAEAVCEGWLYAVADEAGAFLDFIVRGDGKV